jgi:hypothetical protein
MRKNFILRFFIFVLSLICFPGDYVAISAGNSVPFGYRMNSCKVKSVSEPVKIDADWNKKPWNETKAERITNYMGGKPSYFPDVQFKVRYDSKNIYVIFRVEDQYVKAEAKQIHGRVWEDSCVEFFFTPGTDPNRGYFNLETNCKGIFLLQYGKKVGKERTYVDLSDCQKITVAHSLAKDVEKEITEPTTWYIEYAIPLEMLNKYIKVDPPSKDVIWRANFYKCGDNTSHPHWLTWNKVINPEPKFHLPKYFGMMIFQ